MHHRRLSVVRLVLGGLALLGMAGGAAAQTGRVGGVVKDDSGQPIKGATVLAENPSASPRSFTATTDDKGRFSIIGLRSGEWLFTAQAPGFTPEAGRLRVTTIGTPNPPLTFNLKKGAPPATGALGGVAAKDLQAELHAADQLYNAQQWDQAIAAYKAIVAKAPALGVVNLQIASAYRSKAEDVKKKDPKADVAPIYDQAMAAYHALLSVEPNSDKARIGVALTNIERGELDEAEKTLDEAARSVSATKDVFYNLGEIKFAKAKVDEAVKAYERAAELDPNWGKPVFAMGKVALNRGDSDSAVKFFQRVVTVDPLSPEAEQARAAIGQLKR